MEAARYASPWPVYLGASIAAGADLDGDAIPDFVAGAPGYGSRAEGLVLAWSGATGRELWFFVGPTALAGAGRAVAFVPDLDGDGWTDVLVGAPDAMIGGVYTGEVHLLSGRDGRLLRTIPGYTSSFSNGESFGSSLLGVPDLDGDGAGDLVVGSPGADDPSRQWYSTGRVDVYSGATGALLSRTWGATEGEALGSSFALLEDITGDGRPETAVGAPGYVSWIPPWPPPDEGSIVILDPFRGRSLQRFVGDTYERLGHALARVPDLDGDGFPEIAASGRGPESASGGSLRRGSVTVLSSRTGQRLWQRVGEDREELGYALAFAGDVDRNGIQDIVVSRRQTPTRPSALVILDAPDGRTRWEIPYPKPYGSFFGGLASDFDLDGDDLPEIAAGDMDFRLPGSYTSDGAVALFRLDPWLHASATELSAATGGSIVYQVDFPDSVGLMRFALLGSTTGTGPTVLKDVAVPLTDDALFQRMLSGQVSPWLAGTPGLLDAFGDATVFLNVPAGGLAAWVGRTFYAAAVVYHPMPVLSTAAVPLVIRP